jgi:membrane associated rhomboid family serine protease
MKRFTPIVALTGLCWLVFGVNLLLHGQLTQYGVVPRTLHGLWGIAWSPFIHTSLHHLLANTVPLLILGAVLCARGTREFWEVTFGGIALGGALAWLVARTASHVGASGLIFCYFGYLGSQAVFRRTIGALLLTIACLGVYGGILRGILPTSVAISWEGHLAGLAAGVFLAWVNTKTAEPEAKPAAALPKP